MGCLSFSLSPSLSPLSVSSRGTSSLFTNSIFLGNFIAIVNNENQLYIIETVDYDGEEGEAFLINFPWRVYPLK